MVTRIGDSGRFGPVLDDHNQRSDPVIKATITFLQIGVEYGIRYVNADVSFQSLAQVLHLQYRDNCSTDKLRRRSMG